MGFSEEEFLSMAIGVRSEFQEWKAVRSEYRLWCGARIGGRGARAGGDSGSAFLQENMGWDSQAVVKRSDHAEAEWAFVIENF